MGLFSKKERKDGDRVARDWSGLTPLSLRGVLSLHRLRACATGLILFFGGGVEGDVDDGF